MSSAKSWHYNRGLCFYEILAMEAGRTPHRDCEMALLWSGVDRLRVRGRAGAGRVGTSLGNGGPGVRGLSWDPECQGPEARWVGPWRWWWWWWWAPGAGGSLVVVVVIVGPRWSVAGGAGIRASRYLPINIEPVRSEVDARDLGWMKPRTVRLAPPRTAPLGACDPHGLVVLPVRSTHVHRHSVWRRTRDPP